MTEQRGGEDRRSHDGGIETRFCGRDNPKRGTKLIGGVHWPTPDRRTGPCGAQSSHHFALKCEKPRAHEGAHRCEGTTFTHEWKGDG